MKTIIAIICITILETCAIYQSIDGITFSAAVAAIAGLGGFAIGRRTKKK